MKSKFILAFTLLAFSSFAKAAEFNPFDVKAEDTLKLMDNQYEAETGVSAHVASPNLDLQPAAGELVLPSDDSCYQERCHIFADVVKSEQRLYLYVDGVLQDSWPTSTGRHGYGTPNMDRHPDGRIYNVYSSTKYPGFDNMPYVVFIKGGFGIHGAPGEEQNHLGHVDSHGCIRIETTNAKIFNGLVREAGVRNVWVRVR